MISKITGGETELLFTASVLFKYDVKFYRCKDTGFIQTEEPYWLAESYASAITKLDVGLVMRNQNLSQLTVKLLMDFFNHEGRFLDYAGGYGLFTRMMRDKGFDFYHTDIYCQNIFAEYHDLNTLTDTPPFEAVTAFEVLEHLTSPLAEISTLLTHSDNLFFSTVLVPAERKPAPDWWYFSLETGQHVAFYTTQSLQYIANKLGKHFYTDGKELHLFTSKAFTQNPFVQLLAPPRRDPFMIRKMRKLVTRYDERTKGNRGTKNSLLENDTNVAKKVLSR